MFARLLQPFRRAPAATLRPPQPPAAPAASPPGPAEPPPQADAALAEAPPLFAWLLDTEPPAESGAPSAEALALMATLDRHLAARVLPTDLLPRAASVIPQLLALLRSGPTARAGMVDQVLKDAQLTAEVLRLARSPAYGSLAVDTIEGALDRIGTSGLQAAMARVLLRPVFAAGSSGVAARAGARIAALAEYKSLLCAQLVQEAGGDRFEGFLAGLLHDTGALALLRLAERAGATPALLSADASEQALLLRRDRLFGRLVASWDLTPALTALGRHLEAHPLDAGLPLAQALLLADRCARSDLARDGAAPAAVR